MSALAPMPRSAPNRRARLRLKVHVPAYATLGGPARGELLELYEVLDVSETGLALQCPLPLRTSQFLELRLDFAEAPEPISLTARVVWSDAGRLGLTFPPLPHPTALHLKQWLFLNVISAAHNAHVDSPIWDALASAPVQDHSDILAAVSLAQREADSLGADLEAVLTLVASRCRSLLRASGAAIALEGKDPGVMICRASAGPDAPPLGMAMQVSSGFSGECVRTASLLRCDDSESDPRVDRETCRALGIRSLLAAPIPVDERIIGLLELFSPDANAFGEVDAAVARRFADSIAAALHRAIRAYCPPPLPSATPHPDLRPHPAEFGFGGAQGAEKSSPDKSAEQRFSSAREATQERGQETSRETGQDTSQDTSQDQPAASQARGLRLSRSRLYLLSLVAATFSLAVGYFSEPVLRPWIDQKLEARSLARQQTVLAASRALPESSAPNMPSADLANLQQLRQLAAHEDAAAENALGLLYIAGDARQGIKSDESAAVQWFIKAANHGSIPAQSKLGSLYWGGRGVTKDDSLAYFWTVLARANGDDASKVLAPFIAARLTPPQRTAIEQKAEQWLETRESAKNSPH